MMASRRWRVGALAGVAVLGLWSGRRDPWAIYLLPGPRVPAATGEARLQFAPSPFGASVTRDGRLRYNIRITADGLPDPATLGAYRAYVAWEVTTDLAEWHRLGAVGNGTSVVGEANWNKFLLVITAEADSIPASHVGPTVLHGHSPSALLQQFLTHPLFRGISQ